MTENTKVSIRISKNDKILMAWLKKSGEIAEVPLVAYVKAAIRAFLKGKAFCIGRIKKSEAEAFNAESDYTATLRFTQSKDGDIITWLDNIKNNPYVMTSTAIKSILTSSISVIGDGEEEYIPGYRELAGSAIENEKNTLDIP